MPNPQQLADIIELELLRSVEWMQAVECSEGAVIWFDLEEMSLHGWAEVVRVEPCPPIKAGPGRVVMATVASTSSFLMDLRLAGVAEPLHLTDRHRLFSATRQDWIPASELRAGEDLATRSGTARIQSVSAAPGTHRVFNIEAESEHCFFAGSAEVLSHNTEPYGGAKIVDHPSKAAARRAAERDAGMGKHGGRERLPDQPLHPGSQSPQGPRGFRTETRSTDTGRIVHHDPYGHRINDGDDIPPHFGVEGPGIDGTIHHTYPSPHDPRNNR